MTKLSDDEFKEKLWHAIKSDRTIMIGLAEGKDFQFKPMTALLDGERGPIWIFTSTDNFIVKQLSSETNVSAAVATFTSKGHDIFANIQGDISIDNNREVIERLWSNMVAAWYPGGKSDPKLRLLRFDPKDAEIWNDASSLLAGIEMFLGIDPKETVKENVQKVAL